MNYVSRDVTLKEFIASVQRGEFVYDYPGVLGANRHWAGWMSLNDWLGVLGNGIMPVWKTWYLWKCYRKL